MDISHSNAAWQLTYDKKRLYGPQKLSIEEKSLFSFMHCRIDNTSDDSVVIGKSHHYHRGGTAVYEAEGTFALSPAVSLPVSCIHRTAVNTIRMTMDFIWPKETALSSGVEIGSAVLSGRWVRFFTVSPEHAEQADWRSIDEGSTAPISLSPVPAAIVLENADGQRLEIGLGDDLWRWKKGFSSESLKGLSRLELSRSGSKLILRRFVTECPPPPKAPRLPATPVPGASGHLPSTEPPRYIPDCRPYRFNSYIAWSSPELVTDAAGTAELPLLDCSQAGGIDRAALEALGAAPSFRLDLSTLPVDKGNHRNGDSGEPLCWNGRATQRCYRRIIRQIADYATAGTLRLEGMVPGWCETGTHVNKREKSLHWDLNAILDAAIWTRQTLGDEWKIVIPQRGVFTEMPSTRCLGAVTGFRQ